MTEYASLVLKVDSTSAKQAQEDLRGLQAEGTKAEESTGALGKAAGVAGAAIAAAAVATAAMVAASVQAADAAGEAAQAAGLSAEEFTRLQYAMQFDGAPEQLGQSMLFLNKAVADAATGAGKNAEMFGQLGIAIRNQDGTLRSSHDILLDVADQFAGMSDGATKAALATEIFGKSGAEMIPFLNNGAAGIAQLEAESDKLGITLSTNTTQAAGHLNDSFGRLQAAGAGFANNVMVAMLPALNGLGDEMVAAATNSGAMEIAGQALVVVLKSVLTAAVIVSASIQEIGKAVGGLAAAAVQIAEGNLGYAAGIMKETFDNAVDGVSSAATRVDNIWNASATSVEAAEGRKQTAIHATANAAAEAALKASSGGKNSATMDASSGQVVIGTQTIGADLAAAEQERQQNLIAEQAYLDLKAKMYAESDEGQRELRRLKAEDEEIKHQKLMDRERKEREERAKTVGSIERLMEQASAKSKTIAKAAEAYNKARSLVKITQDTYTGAVGAYQAMASIPFVGPALGIAAAGAVIAFGATAASAVGGGISGRGVPTGVGGTSSLAPPTSVVQATPAQSNMASLDITVIGKGLPSWEQVGELFDMIGERLADSGGRMGKVRLVTQ